MKQKHFATIEDMVCKLKPGYPVYCLRPATLEANARRFLDLFPGRVLYAVKCNPHIEVLKSFYRAGIRHFDTASLGEIALIRENFPHADCYFMHPVKSRSAIRSGHEVYAVDHFVIDHETELEKLVDVTGGGDGQVCIVRIITPQYEAMSKLSEKFGAPPEHAARLLRKVEAAGFQTGLAFHVGSQCVHPEAFTDAMKLVGEIIDEAGVAIHYLDVGGGFPADYIGSIAPPLENFMDAIKKGREKIRLRGDTVLMCEPGRALVASGCSLVVQVQLRKDDRLYVNDGIYHSLSETRDGIRVPMRLVRPNKPVSSEHSTFVLFGPTCDSVDVLPYRVSLPEDVQEGDWIEIGQLGAYSNAMATRFNGFHPETFVTVDAEPLLPEEAVGEA